MPDARLDRARTSTAFPSGLTATPTAGGNQIARLQKRREVVLADLLMKAEIADWHGVQDCGSDLREIDAMLSVLNG